MLNKTLKFCNDMCREAYRTDMIHGLVYGQVKYPDGRVAAHATACAEEGRCPYCADLVKEVKSDGC